MELGDRRAGSRETEKVPVGDVSTGTLWLERPPWLPMLRISEAEHKHFIRSYLGAPGTQMSEVF